MGIYNIFTLLPYSEGHTVVTKSRRENSMYQNEVIKFLRN